MKSPGVNFCCLLAYTHETAHGHRPLDTYVHYVIVSSLAAASGTTSFSGPQLFLRGLCTFQESLQRWSITLFQPSYSNGRLTGRVAGAATFPAVQLLGTLLLSWLCLSTCSAQPPPFFGSPCSLLLLYASSSGHISKSR